MKRIIFNNPPNSLFKSLKNLGLVDYYELGDDLSKKKIPMHGIEGLSSNPYWGDFTDKNLKTEDYNKKYFNIESNLWKSATVDLSEQGLEILQGSGIKGWKILKDL